jgi:type I restriction enzyme R subunit
MQAVRTILTKRDPTTALSDDAKEHALRQILSRAVVSAEVMDIFKAAGLDRPDVGILSDEFLGDVRKLKREESGRGSLGTPAEGANQEPVR